MISILRITILIVAAGVFCGPVAVYSDDDDVALLKLHAYESEDRQELRLLMADLVGVGSTPAAEAYIEVLEKNVESNNSDVPRFLFRAFEFPKSIGTSTKLREALHRLRSTVSDGESEILVAGLISRYSDRGENETSWLIDKLDEEHTGVGPFRYSTALLMEVIVLVDSPRTTEFAVSYALRQNDPSLKLITAKRLLGIDSPASLGLLREWMKTNPDDYELGVAETYLEAISRYGDHTDANFIAWIEENFDQYFLQSDIDALQPLVDRAVSRLSSADAVPKRRWGSWIAIFAFSLITIVTLGFLYSRKK